MQCPGQFTHTIDCARSMNPGWEWGGGPGCVNPPMELWCKCYFTRVRQTVQLNQINQNKIQQNHVPAGSNKTNKDSVNFSQMQLSLFFISQCSVLLLDAVMYSTQVSLLSSVPRLFFLNSMLCQHGGGQSRGRMPK